MSADPTSPLTFAVGDIHGCLGKLTLLLPPCELHADGRPASHDPVATGAPDLRGRRLNLDPAAVMGGALRAAAFDDTKAPPMAFLTDEGAERGSLGRGGARS